MSIDYRISIGYGVQLVPKSEGIDVMETVWDIDENNLFTVGYSGNQMTGENETLNLVVSREEPMRFDPKEEYPTGTFEPLYLHLDFTDEEKEVLQQLEEFFYFNQHDYASLIIMSSIG